MKLIIAISLMTVVLAEKLSNTYLPPTGTRTFTGSNNFVVVPSQATYSFNQVSKNQLPYSAYGTPELTYQPQNQHSARPIQIIRYISENNADGSYQFDYQTENKINQREIGQLKNAGTNQEASVVHGSYSYAAPDGQVYTVDYVADENGFRPSGSHLPTPPPTPDLILKSLQENAAAGATEFNNEGYKQNIGYQY